jgi:hypothetical protein
MIVPGKLLASVVPEQQQAELLRQARHDNAVAPGASDVSNLELIATLGEDRPLIEPVKGASDRPGAAAREDLERASHRRLEAENQSQRAAGQIDDSTRGELGVAAENGAVDAGNQGGRAGESDVAGNGNNSWAGRHGSGREVDRARPYTEREKGSG